MKYVDEYRQPLAVRRYTDLIARSTTQPWTIMEVCGGQTHSILRHGLDALLPDGLELLHGPGCPVCVTAAETIDHAIAIAARPEVVLCSFGDMLRVPGSHTDLLSARAAGADVRMVYSPGDALALARSLPERQVVFFAVGFETTAPTTALVAEQARAEGLENFSLLVAHVRVPPAMELLLADSEVRIDGFLAAGHVCTVMGHDEYRPIAARHGVPVVVTGFEPVDLLAGVLHCVRQLEAGTARVENAYGRVVREAGNPAARALMRQVFVTVERHWRGIGAIPASGLALAAEYAHLDAARRFADTAPGTAPGASPCIAGDILRGLRRPPDCPAFASACTPDHPLGATMVSSEGACAAYHRYRRVA